MAKVLFPAFRDEQSISHYPFGDSCDLTSDDDLAFDTGLFLDASLYPSGAYDKLAITSIVTSYSEITIYVGNQGNLRLLSVTYNPFYPPDVLSLLQDDKLAGILLPDQTLLTTLMTWPDGEHIFSEGSADFVPSVVIARPYSGVTGLQLSDGTIVSGDVWLVGDEGVVLSVESSTIIRFDVVGDPLFKRRLCEVSNNFQPTIYLKHLWFIDMVTGSTLVVAPDTTGTVNLLVGTNLHLEPALRIQPVDNGLTIYVIGSSSRPRTA